MNLPQPMIPPRHNSRPPSRPPHQLMSDQSSQMHDPTRTHRQTLQNEIADVEIARFGQGGGEQFADAHRVFDEVV